MIFIVESIYIFLTFIADFQAFLISSSLYRSLPIPSHLLPFSSFALPILLTSYVPNFFTSVPALSGTPDNFHRPAANSTQRIQSSETDSGIPPPQSSSLPQRLPADYRMLHSQKLRGLRLHSLLQPRYPALSAFFFMQPFQLYLTDPHRFVTIPRVHSIAGTSPKVRRCAGQNIYRVPLLFR